MIGDAILILSVQRSDSWGCHHNTLDLEMDLPLQCALWCLHHLSHGCCMAKDRNSRQDDMATTRLHRLLSLPPLDCTTHIRPARSRIDCILMVTPNHHQFPLHLGYGFCGSSLLGLVYVQRRSIRRAVVSYQDNSEQSDFSRYSVSLLYLKRAL